MRIGDAAAAAGTTARALRFYEQRGLLPRRAGRCPGTASTPAATCPGSGSCGSCSLWA